MGKDGFGKFFHIFVYKLIYVKRIIRAIRRRGVWNSVKALYDRYWFELRYGLNMQSEKIAGQAETLKTNYKYEPISHYVFNRMMKKVNWNFRDSTFLDFGCGKGAAILLATQYHFKKYIGVEYSRDLVDGCVANVEKFSKKARQRIPYEIVCTDAAMYQIPPDGNVFYFFNPFNRDLLDTVLQNIDLSVKKHSRNVLLFYFNAQFKDVIEKHGYKEIFSEPADKVNIWYQFGNYAYLKNN